MGGSEGEDFGEVLGSLTEVCTGVPASSKCFNNTHSYSARISPSVGSDFFFFCAEEGCGLCFHQDATQNIQYLVQPRVRPVTVNGQSDRPQVLQNRDLGPI